VKEITMKIAVRYYSRTGNTKAYAEAIAKGAGVNAVSVDAVDAPITEPVDTLFLGGGLYAYGIDSHLKDYIAKLDAKLVSKAVVFSTSWLSRHALDLIRKALEEKGIAVEEKTLYAKSKQVSEKAAEAEAFAKNYL